MPGFAATRRWFDKLGPKPVRAALLTAGALLPYVIVSVRLGDFEWRSLLLLSAVVAVASFWYAWIKPNFALDLLFLAFMAGVYVSRIFPQIYPRPVPHLQLEILGRLMWVRLGIFALLSIRRIEEIRFGFAPSSAEWRIGVEQFLYFLPVGALAAYLLSFARFHAPALAWWKMPLFVVGTFLAMLWVQALGEEFFFRGFLQPLLSRGLRSQAAGLLAASTLFGLAHLPFRAFPNWRFAILAGIAGVFYGLAFLRARSVRASIVTHALVVTTWRVFFAG
jgi:membrane protease YdiL (CAAX protease family)